LATAQLPICGRAQAQGLQAKLERGRTTINDVGRKFGLSERTLSQWEAVQVGSLDAAWSTHVHALATPPDLLQQSCFVCCTVLEYTWRVAPSSVPPFLSLLSFVCFFMGALPLSVIRDFFIVWGRSFASRRFPVAPGEEALRQFVVHRLRPHPGVAPLLHGDESTPWFGHRHPSRHQECGPHQAARESAAADLYPPRGPSVCPGAGLARRASAPRIALRRRVLLGRS
jgi:hypothetical protein